MANYMPWSYSRLSDFESCALRFQHKYILKNIPFVTNEAMEQGKAKHKMLERDTVRAINNKPSACPDVAHVFPIIQSFVAKHPIVSVEQQWAFNQKLKPVDWFAKDVMFRAIVDMVGRTNVKSREIDQTASVIDWKSGQFRLSEDQLKIYNMSVLLQWPQVISSEAALVFIDQKKISPVLKTPRSHLDGIVDEFMDRSEAIQIAVQKDTWPATQCFQCRWCEVQDCQYIRR